MSRDRNEKSVGKGCMTRGNAGHEVGVGECSSPEYLLLQLKGSMNTTSATRTSDSERPLFLRVVRKWYSWAGLGLTLTASYLAFDGQLKLDGCNLLQAAPAIEWKANSDTPKIEKPESDVPVESVTQADEVEHSPVGVQIPEVVEVPTGRMNAANNPKLSAILDSYALGDSITQSKYEDVESKEDLKIPVPLPPEKSPTVPKLETLEVVVPAEKKTDAKNDKRPSLPLPPRKLNVSADITQGKTTNAKEPGAKGPDDKAPGEPIRTLPTPESVNSALAVEVESLKENELLVYTAAQNAMKMKNYAVAIERYEALFKLRPDLLHIRAEFAGVLITAGEVQRAIDQYKKVVELMPSSISFRIRLGDAYIIAKDYKRAIQMFTEVLKTPPFEPEYAVRLARAYVFDSDFQRATLVYDRYLANIQPDDPKAPVALGALLLDLDRPAEAMPYLLAKRKQLEKDLLGKEIIHLEVLASLVRGYARLGERQAALEIITEMAARATDQIAVRQVLGDTLYLIEEFELAAQVYNQILQLDPMNGPALIGMARVHNSMQLPANARKILDSFRPAPGQVRDYLITYSVYHQRIGEYVEAKQIYLDMLRRNPNDHAVRYSLGELFDFLKEWEKAKAEFAKIPPYGALGRDARRAFAESLYNQRKFKEALEVDNILLSEDPTDYLTIAQTIKHYAKAELYEQGIALGRGYLATNPKSENQANTVRLALARALLDANKNLDAAREYEIVLSKPSGRTVLAYYGLARASEKLGNPERARQLASCTVGLPGGDFRNRLIVADLYSADHDDNRVIEICMSLLNIDGTHMPTLIRLLDAQQRLSRFSGNPADVFATAQTILGISPTNVRGHLGMARSFSVAQNYRKASGQYDQLIQIDTEFLIPQTERARVLYADHQFSAARSQYQAMQKISPDEQLIINLNGTVQREPKVKPLLEPYLIAGVNGGALRKELGRMSLVVPDLEQKLALQRLIADYDARQAEQTAIHLEQEAKELKDYRPFRALEAQAASVAYEPTNTEILFDMAQQLGSLHRNAKELDVLSQVLKVDPTHRDSMVASERSEAEISPKLDGMANYFSQRGRNGLSSIDRTRYTVDGSIPLGDENEFLQLGYSRAFYRSPFDYPHTIGNIPFLRAQKRFCDDLLLAYGQVNFEEYRNGFKTRPTFDVGAIYQYCDWVWLRGGGYLENVAENGESIRQDIYRGGIYAGADVRPTRLWGFGGTWRYARYSDNNDANFLDLYNELLLTLPPKELKLVQKLYFQGFRDGTIFPTNPPDERNIFGAVHPYFSPRGYVQLEQRIEWWHWLSRDYFVHSNQCYYSLQYGIMTDNNLQTFHNLRALVNYDVCTWLTLGAQADAQLSSVYRMFSAMGYFQIRFK